MGELVDPVAAAAVGLLVLRVALGGVYILHGLRKLGWRNPAGFAGFTASIGRRGFRPARLWALAAVAAEVPGGLLLCLGLFLPLAGTLMVAQSVTIVWLSRPKGFWHDGGGIEYPLVLLAAAMAATLVGAGPISLDAALGFAWDPLLGPAAVALGIASALAGIGTRRRDAPQPAAA